MFLSIGNVLKYLNATPDSRNFVEGERLLNASHLILCGIEEKCEANLNIFALCLQTSALSLPPHEISGIIKNSVENGMSVTSMSCTCKAGLGGHLQTYCGSSSVLHKFFIISKKEFNYKKIKAGREANNNLSFTLTRQGDENKLNDRIGEEAVNADELTISLLEALEQTKQKTACLLTHSQQILNQLVGVPTGYCMLRRHLTLLGIEETLHVQDGSVEEVFSLLGTVAQLTEG
ncbi:hypothetical protein NQ317_004599 [Molorchus minor]|uniref:Uncharacterized protein n=1 Tax=Molorchus minor TaxID=1323400 RepID=A0ABQ9JU34_9CUCU|nr:hypothetical protein NQ317_004599 [Molorchus minor]